MSQERMKSSEDKKQQSNDVFKAPNIDSTLERSNTVTEKVRVVHGVHEEYFDLQGKTIGSVRKSLRDAYNLPGDAVAFVAGEPVEDDHILESGSNLEFTKEAGVKGNHL